MLNFTAVVNFAQEIDPIGTTQAITEAKSVHEILAIVVGVLLTALIILVLFYLKRWTALEKTVETLKENSETLRTDILDQLKAERARNEALNAESRAMLNDFLETLKGE